METNNIVDFGSRDGITDTLTEMLRRGAQQLIATAVETELEGYLNWFHLIGMAQKASPRACLAAAISNPCIQFGN